MRQNKDRDTIIGIENAFQTLDSRWRATHPRKIGERAPREERLQIKPERPSKSEEYGLN